MNDISGQSYISTILLPGSEVTHYIKDSEARNAITAVETGIRIPQHALDCAGMPHGQYSCLDLMNGASTVVNLLGDTLLPVQVKGHDAALYRISATE